MEKKVSVIIPAFNEEENIANVIDKSKKCKYVEEIIVVDNKSTDKTQEVAMKKGAKVVRCEQQGKGYAMEEGIKNALGDIIVFLDADVKYEEEIIDILVEPILDRKVDFVKSTFKRTIGGKVTQIAVKPLLKIVFPNMYDFSEPISGMIATKKEILQKIKLEKDYGVDIGILIDIINMKYRVEEVNIGNIENMSHHNKDMNIMQRMSTEVMQAILKRAK
jgi:glucosyl-3-phosphoglycerate synthase